jgi:hypothetical protein
MDRAVSSPVAARRLELCAAARLDPQAFLRFDRARLRFSLGTSLADLSIPVELSADARAIVRAEAAEVALLLATHHKRYLPADELDRLILREDYARLPAIPALLGATAGGPDLRAAALTCTLSHPALPGGLAAAWLGKGGKGRSLVGLWIELVRRALGEMREARGEDTPLLVALSLFVELSAAEVVVRDAIPAGHADRYLRTAAMTALWVAARTGVARAFRDAGGAAVSPLLARIEVALSPSALLGGRPGVQSGGSTLYGVELSAGIPRGDELVARLAAGGDPEAARAEIAAQLGAEEALSVRAEQAVAVARLREALGQAVMLAEAQGQAERVQPVREILCGPGALAGGATDAAARQSLIRQLLAALPAGEPGAVLDRAHKALREWRPREPAAVFGLTRERARAEYATAAAALCADLALERMAAPARKAITFRTGREAEGGADAEYEAGRLYRLSARPGPILKSADDRPVAHLFADVKDFTRRTALLGQAAMAEFLRREFYLPIVVAAKEHYGGMQHLADRGGMQLNNLLGDAISFSGRIEAMVELAKSIRRAFAAYAAQLAREFSGEVMVRQLAALERELESASPEERARQLARARGEGLEAGVFISHGPAPLVVVIEDEVFGTNRVAIADKINESARGTARAPSARAAADAWLAAERVARRSPQLQHAWSVFIGQPLTLPVPPELEVQALAAARAGDLAGAMRTLAGPVREGLEAAARRPVERPGDIYNSGTALSEEALVAFLHEVERDRLVRRVELAPAEVPDHLKTFFWFGAEPQSLVACFHPDGRLAELFRRVGRAAFKGLGGVVVWELCSEGGGPAALAKVLGPGWFSGPR